MTTRRKFLSFLACFPGLSWLTPKLSAAEIEDRDNAMLREWRLQVDEKGSDPSDGQWWLDTRTGTLSFEPHQSPHDAYEAALDLFLGPVKP